MKRIHVAWVVFLLTSCQATDTGKVLSPTMIGTPSQPTALAAKVSYRATLLPPTEPPASAIKQCSSSSVAMEGQITTPALAIVPEQIIDFPTALSRAGVDNPTIALAVEAVRASQAQQLQAHALLLPHLLAGGNFDWHEGNLQSGQGAIIDVRRQSLYAGAGTDAVGAGTVGLPGVYLVSHLGDALFEPRAAAYRAAGRQFDAEATRNSVLLEVATRYFTLAGAEARLKAMRQSQADFEAIAKVTTDHAKAGQGREADARRAQTEVTLAQATAQRIEEDVAVAAAELARLLDFEPGIRLQVPFEPLPQLELVDSHSDLESLMAIALRNRPEIAARAADMAEAETRLRKEEVRPLLPTITVGFSAGGFGGGGTAESGIAHFSSRTDFDASAFWSLQNFGFGNLAMQREMRAQVVKAGAYRVQAIDIVREEVADALALTAARRREIDVALRRLSSSQRAMEQDLVRTRNLVGRPIEALDSARLLSTARQDHVRAVIGYNQAQLQLFVSLGQPP